MLSIIWNITNLCKWNCAFCCMDSGPAYKRPEMTREEKLRVADNLACIDGKVDLSGGEPMLLWEETYPVLEKLSAGIGKERLGMSCSGAFIDDEKAQLLSEVLSEVEMTMDAHPDREYPYRQNGYHKTAAKSAVLLRRYGITVGLQTIITREHQENPAILQELYSWLSDNGIDNWSIIKFFPSGRGAKFPHLELNNDECFKVVEDIRTLDAKNCSTVKPKLDIHYLMPGTEKDSACRCVKKSIGILPDGKVTSCFWALGCDGIVDPRFYLGDLKHQRLEAILADPRAAYWRDYSGRCPLAAKEIL